ncbi:ATPase [Taylorella equigenitalis MCE9]|uniref:ATPase n=2 Tax=Taylorella equigenitalis TaxID=29575 RepID=A0A654KI15_TAYEM|nr:ATPase [Taylorella equigenitalis MCE9]
MLQYVSDRRAEIQETYGNVTPATVGAIQRKLLELEQQGADNFFGEPMLDIFDLMRVDHNGNGMVNILAADKLMRSPKLYGVFLLWLLAEIYEALPEVGDLEKPKFVFFFDEAHLVFEDAPDALLDKIELIVRLSRSKGIGVYFVTQNPLDIPEAVLGQLGNRVQHALRAYTPRDQKAVRTTAETMRPNPKINIEQAITELGVGEALVSLLDEKGAPSVTERAWMVAPDSRIGPITDLERNQLKNSSHVYGKYEKVVDRESAFEVLQKRATMANEVAQQEANSAGGSSGVVGIFKDFMIGSTGPRGGHRDGIIQRAVKNEASRMTSRLIRGVLGSLLGGRR